MSSTRRALRSKVRRSARVCPAHDLACARTDRFRALALQALDRRDGNSHPTSSPDSHVGSFLSCEGPERAPGAEFQAASAGAIGCVQGCRFVCSFCVLLLSPCPWCDERACTVGAWCTTVVNLRVCACNKVAVPHFNIILSSTVLGLVTRPRPRRTISVSGIRLERFVAPGKPSLGSASETPHASVRSSGGFSSISHLTRCHVVVGQSSVP